jgi:hypothetical protein
LHTPPFTPPESPIRVSLSKSLLSTGKKNDGKELAAPPPLPPAGWNDLSKTEHEWAEQVNQTSVVKHEGSLNRFIICTRSFLDRRRVAKVSAAALLQRIFRGAEARRYTELVRSKLQIAKHAENSGTFSIKAGLLLLVVLYLLVAVIPFSWYSWMFSRRSALPPSVVPAKASSSSPGLLYSLVSSTFSILTTLLFSGPTGWAVAASIASVVFGIYASRKSSKSGDGGSDTTSEPVGALAGLRLANEKVLQKVLRRYRCQETAEEGEQLRLSQDASCAQGSGESAVGVAKVLEEAVRRLEEENVRMGSELQQRKQAYRQKQQEEKRTPGTVTAGLGEKQQQEKEAGAPLAEVNAGAGTSTGLRQRKQLGNQTPGASHRLSQVDTPVLFQQPRDAKVPISLGDGVADSTWSPPPRGSTAGQRQLRQQVSELVEVVFPTGGSLGFDFEGPHPMAVGGVSALAVVRSVCGQAARVGLEVGDVITAVGNKSVAGNTHAEIVASLKTAIRPCVISVNRKSAAAKRRARDAWKSPVLLRAEVDPPDSEEEAAVSPKSQRYRPPARSPVARNDRLNALLLNGLQKGVNRNAAGAGAPMQPTVAQHLPFSPSADHTIGEISLTDMSMTDDVSSGVSTPQHAQQQEKEQEQGQTEEQEQGQSQEYTGRPSLDNNRGSEAPASPTTPPATSPTATVASPSPAEWLSPEPLTEADVAPINPPEVLLEPAPAPAPVRATALAPPPPFAAAHRRASWSASAVTQRTPAKPKLLEQDIIFPDAGAFGFEFSGGGLVIDMDPSGQAVDVGMVLGDMIRAVDGVDTEGFNHEEIVELLQGRARPRTVRVARG